MPPPGYEPFLKMICANPADDAPRLVYADWLDENGEPERAEFIRLQIELNRIRPPQIEPPELLARERVLRRIAETTWRAELPVWPNVIWRQYWRGFIHRIEFRSFVAFRACAAAAFARTPLNGLELWGIRSREVPSFVKLTELQRLSLLILKPALDSLTPHGWSLLANSPNLANLEWLMIMRNRPNIAQLINVEAARQLTQGSALRKLQRLFIMGVADERTAELLREHFGERVSMF